MGSQLGIGSRDQLRKLLNDRDPNGMKRHWHMFYPMLDGRKGSGWNDLCEQIATLFAELETVGGVKGYKLSQRLERRQIPPNRIRHFIKFINGEVERGSMDCPSYPWFRKLAGVIEDRQPAWLRVIPGNGLDELVSRLPAHCGDAHAVRVDLSDFDVGETVIEHFERSLPASAALDRLSEAAIAGVLAGGRMKLIIVVGGAGGHARERSKESFAERIRELRRFQALDKGPAVSVVIVSPLHPRHFFPTSSTGSRPNFVSVWPDEGDQAVFDLWARQQLKAWPKAQIEAILSGSQGQLAPVLAAMDSYEKDSSAAMAERHKAAGEELFLKYFGPCCVDAVQGKAGGEACLRGLQDAKIVQIVDGKPQPTIPQWSEVWN